MGNTNTAAKGNSDHRTFSPEFPPGIVSPRDSSSASPRPSDYEGLYEGPKKLLLSQHSNDYSNEGDDEFRVSINCLFC